MTNQQPSREDFNGESPRFRDKVWRIIKQPRTQIIAVVGLGAIVIAGYIGGRLIITNVLPPRVEKELEKLLARDVSLGEVTVEGFSQIIIDDVTVAATQKDASNLEIDIITIDVNFWPLLTKGRLFLDVVADEVTGYAQLDTLLPESEEKKPLPESLLLPSLPISTDIHLQLQDTKLAVAPNAETKAIAIDTQGKLEFLYDKKKQPLKYQLENRIGNSNINIEGETLLSNTQSQNQIDINNLYLPEVVPIIPQLPAQIKEGILNANLAINTPSLTKLQESTAQGNITMANVTGKLDANKINLEKNISDKSFLEEDFVANIDIEFNQQLATIAQAKLDWGEANAKVEGTVDWQKGYDLQVKLESVPVSNILPIIGVTTPVNVDGLASSNINITGEIDKPVITGNLEVENSIIDQINFGKIESQFTGNLEELDINKLSIKPAFGGEITAQAFIRANLRETLFAGKPLQLDDTSFNLKFLANLPPNPFIKAYNISDYGVDFGNLVAKGEIKGSLNQPQGVINFAIPQIQANNFEGVKAEGKLVINQQKLELVDTQLVADNNPINIDGSGDFKTKKWQISVTGKDFNLTPFIAQFCDNNSACLSAQVNTNLPIILTRLDSNFQGSLTSLQLKDIQGKGDLNIQVNNGNLNLDTTLVKGKLLVNGNASDIALSQIFPSLPTSVNVVNSKINLSTDVAELLTIDKINNLPPSFSLQAETQLDVDTGMIEAVAKIDSQEVNITADVSQIPLNQIIPSLPAEITSSEIKISADTQELYQLATQGVKYDGLLSLDSLNVTANLDSKLADGTVNTIAKVRNGTFTLEGATNNVSPSLLLPTANLPPGNLNANFKVEGNLSELISFGVNYLENKTVSPLPSLRANADGQLNIGEGKALVTAKLENNQWQTKIDSDNIDLANIAQGLSLDENLGINLSASLPNLSSNINLSGSLNKFSGKKPSLPVEINPSSVTLGENVVDIKGNLDVVNILQQTDIDNLQLQVATESQLKTIEVAEIFTPLYSNQGINLIPREINLAGNAKFSGAITGSNLLTNPLGENGLNLLGDLTLTNFQINQLEFEPYLTGKVTVNPQSKIALDLKGKQDVISASWVKDSLFIADTQSTFAYIPQNIEIRQGGEDGFSLLGSRKGNEFLATINNLPLDNLQLQPAVNYGIDGKLRGYLSAEIALNLNNFNAKGNLTLNQPGLDFINAQQISANFVYQDNIALVNDGVLKFGKTEYNLTGKYNLKTQDIDGKIDLQGDVEDIFTTLKITDIQTLTAFAKQLKTGDYFADVDDIPSQSVGADNNTIESQVNLLSSIDQQITAIAQQIREGKLPNDLDIIGDYEGEIIIAGNLKNPIINFDLTGEKWQWLPQQDFPNIVDALGFVMEQTEAVAIPKVSVNALFKNNNLTLKPLLINIAGSEISFIGDISAQSQNGKFKINQFPLDLATRFFPLPVDLESIIDLEGTIKGRFINPEIEGVLTLNNTAIDSAIIEEKIVNNFTYKNYELALKTVFPEYITFNANLPYHPIFENNKPAFIDFELDERSMSILGILTEEKFTISGGEYRTKLNVKIDSISQLIDNFDLEKINITGDLNFQDTEISSVFLKEAVSLSGDINLSDNQIINVDSLIAKVNNTNVNIQGSLPILKPLTQNDNLLTVNIPNQSLNLEKLYSGNLDANIQINGTVLKPQIGGYLSLNNGNFEIPSRDVVSNTKSTFLWNQWLGDSLNTTIKSIINPDLDNFTLKLENSQLAQWGLYRFLFEGDLKISGPVLDFDNLRADGEINIRRGQVYLGGATPFTSVVSGLSSSQTTFYLSRTNDNKITFNPNDSILNPDLDIQVKADIVDYSREIPATQRNEVNDPLIRGGRGESVQVVLDIEGGLAQLLPVLSGSINRSCNFPVADTIPEDAGLPPEKLEPVAKCVNLAVLNPNLSNTNNILSSPLVSLSSTPSRGEGELINLIVGGQLLNLATQLQNFSGQDLLENGLVQFVLVPIANTVGFGINERVSTWGQPLGMKDVRVFPLVEGVYEVGENANVSLSYDYIYDEYKVRYQMRF